LPYDPTGDLLSHRPLGSELGKYLDTADCTMLPPQHKQYFKNELEYCAVLLPGVAGL